MKIRCLQLFLFPLEDLHCGFGAQQTNILPSLDYIPGRVVRGGLANWALRQGKMVSSDPLFQNLFYPDHQGAASHKISYPWCTYQGYLPAPLSLFELKGGGSGDPRLTLVEAPPEPFPNEDNQLTPASLHQPVDFLKRGLWPSQVDSRLKPVSGLVSPLSSIGSKVSLAIDLKAPHDENTGRVGKDGQALYAEEALPPSSPRFPRDSFYSGKLAFEDKEEVTEVFKPLQSLNLPSPERIPSRNLQTLRDLLKNPPPQHLLFLGRRRVPVVVYAYAETGAVIDTENNVLPDELAPDQEEITLTFTTDYQRPFPLTAEIINHDCSLSFEKVRVFSAPSLAHQFDVQKNQPLPPQSTIKAGSCGRFRIKGGLTETQARNLWVKSWLGMGPSARDGFGRFRVNWNLHQIRGED